MAQLKKWAALQSKGYTNKDVLTKTNNIQDFEQGKAAMMVDGTWDTAQYTKAMGSNVAAFVPPFSSTPIKGVVEYPGDGFSVMKYSKNKAAAFKFIDFLTTTQAGNIINQAGLIPDIAGLTTSNPVNQQMLDFVTKGHMVAYPMMDNYIQVNVGNAATRSCPPCSATSSRHCPPCRTCSRHGSSCHPHSGAPRASASRQQPMPHPHPGLGPGWGCPLSRQESA